MAIRTGKKNVSNTIKIEINRLYIKGYNMAMIGKLLSLSHTTVGNHVLIPRKSGTYTEIRG